MILYELLMEVDGSAATAHIGLIDVEELRRRKNEGEIHPYAENLTEKSTNLTGKNGHLAGGGGVPPARFNGFANKDLITTWRPDGNAHQGGVAEGLVTVGVD